MDELLSLFGGAVDYDDNASSSAAPHQSHASGHRHADTANIDFRSALLGGGNVAATAPPLPSSSATSSSSASSCPLRRRSINSTTTYPTYPTNSTNNAKTATTKHVTNTTNATPCDPITGLRIVDRRTSRADMVDAFSSYTYRTCSILAAASRVEWSREYLVDGGQSSHPNTDGSNSIGGKTNIATCGILTCETSSRLSSKTGRAFATLTLGDLPSSSFTNNSSSNEIHASVTVFLFGDALSVLRAGTKQYLRPGWAVAILGPNLMPPRSDNGGGGGSANTSVTLSVNDPRQILPIGRVVDCDRCRGTIRKRSVLDGAPPRWEDVRCSTLVDMRHSGGRGYCQMHRKQGLSSAACSSGGGTNKSRNKGSSNLTFIQRQRNESTMQNNKTTMQEGTSAHDRNSRHGIEGASSTYSSLSALLHEHPATSLLTGPKTCNMKRAPLHMKKLPNGNEVGLVNAAANSMNVKPMNPYMKANLATNIKDFTISTTTDPKRKHSLHDVLGEALDGKRSRSTIASDKRPSQIKVFNTNGYDGSVQVPKPNSILFRNGGSSTSCSTHATSSLPMDRQSSTSIMEKQRSLAELLKRSSGASDSFTANAENACIDKQSLSRSKQKILSNGRGGMKVALPRAPNNNNTTTTRQHRGMNDFASAFSTSSISTDEQLVSNDPEAIMNAKSRFASAVNAEEYARARSVVQALESKEGANESRSTSRKKDAKAPPLGGSIVTTGWACHTCNKTTSFKPVSCIHARHDVRQRRELKGGTSKSLGSQKNRLDMHGKEGENDGLTLGSGLEWSGWRGGFG